MKMVKSLLLGSAAGLVAVAGAQAADLPVKAKPVEYVKVCSLYGAGYYYMPGTDICVKLGGYVRWQITWNPGANISAGPLNGPGGRMTRVDSQETAQRTRALITVDTRQQTAYGTLRTYILLGFSQDSTAAESTSPAVYMTRGFLQIAGFTFGKATSFFDIVPGASFSYNAGMFYHPDTGDAGKMLAAYTAQFGNGVSGTIAIEQARVTGISRTPGSVYAPSAIAAPFFGDGYLGVATSEYPDVVGNIRIDQSWGTWLVAAAAHAVRGQYWGPLPGNTLNGGAPDSKVGWAVTTGFIWNLPMIAPGDRLSAGIVYSEGAVKYAAVTPAGGALNLYEGSKFGMGYWEDAIYEGGITPAAPCGAAGAGLVGLGGCGKLQLTTAWSASAAFEHLWTPALRTSWYGSYVDVSHNAAGNFLICNGSAVGAGNFTPGNPALTGCNSDWSAWNVGSRTQWEPVKGLIMGIDVIYNKLNTAQPNFLNAVALPTAGGLPATTAPFIANCAPAAPAAGVPCYRTSDMDAWTGTFRVQRDFLP
jgi:hypothetical protein